MLNFWLKSQGILVVCLLVCCVAFFARVYFYAEEGVFEFFCGFCYVSSTFAAAKHATIRVLAYYAMEAYENLLSHPSNHKHVTFMEALKI